MLHETIQESKIFPSFCLTILQDFVLICVAELGHYQEGISACKKREADGIQDKEFPFKQVRQALHISFQFTFHGKDHLASRVAGKCSLRLGD